MKQLKVLPLEQTGSLPKVGQERFGGVPQTSPVDVGQEKPETSERLAQEAASAAAGKTNMNPQINAKMNDAGALLGISF